MSALPSLYHPSLIHRDSEGVFWHPDLPAHEDPDDEEKDIGPLIREQGFEHVSVMGEEADGFSDDVMGDGGEAYWAAMRAWQPTPPSGEGWLLASIMDTEDGPAALWVRKVAA